MAFDAIRRNIPFGGHKPEQQADQSAPEPPASAAEEAEPVEPLNLEALANLDALDIPGLKRGFASLGAAIRQAEADLPVVEAEAKAAFEKNELQGVQASWARKAKLQADRTDYLAHQERVWTAIRARLQPEVDSWEADTKQTVQRWREEQAKLVARIDEVQAELGKQMEELSGLRHQRQSEQQAFVARYEAIAQKARAFAPPMPQVDWDVPDVDYKSLGSRLADMSRKALTWMVTRR